RMTMAYSIEARVPFAAPSILSLANDLKYHHMINGNTLKWGLRTAFQDMLPIEVIDRPKHGFNVPIDHWLKKEWRDMLDETFSSTSELSKYGFIDKNSNKVAFQMLSDQKRLNGHTLFCFIMLNRWLSLAK